MHAPPEPALAALAERFWQFQRHEFPYAALLAGDPDASDATLFREGPDDVQRRAERAAGMLEELRRIPLARLQADDRVTHRLLERELSDLVQTAQTLSHLRPWLLPVGPEFNAVFFANGTELRDEGDARRYVQRLRSLPAFFADVLACLREGRARGLRFPAEVLRAALANQRSMARTSAPSSPWMGPFRRAASTGAQRHADDALQVIEAQLLPALGALADAVETELLPQARASVSCTEEPGGRAYYEFWVRHFTTTEQTPEALHALGLREVERLESELGEWACRDGHAGDLPGYRHYLASDGRFRCSDADELRKRMERLCDEIVTQLPVLFGRLPVAGRAVRSIPEALAERMPAAYAQPSPTDQSAPGVFWVTSLTEKAPTWMHVPLALHEAWPGHLMHIARMQELTHLPTFRRAGFTRHSACLEGWALYSETLGLDLGLYRSPSEHFGRLDMEMWRACRLVVDTGLHVHGWSRSEAIDYLDARLSLTRRTLEDEVDRYIAMPAQALAYQVGGLAFRAQRRRAEEALDGRFDLKAFHDEVLSTGPMTLPVLDEVVGAWIAGQTEGACHADR